MVNFVMFWEKCYFSVLSLFCSLCLCLLWLTVLREAGKSPFPRSVWEDIKGGSKIYILPGKGGAKDFLRGHEDVAFEKICPAYEKPSHSFLFLETIPIPEKRGRPETTCMMQVDRKSKTSSKVVMSRKKMAYYWRIQDLESRFPPHTHTHSKVDQE